MDLSKYTKPELDVMEENLNLTDDERVVFHMLSKRKSRIEIADRLNTSVRTVDNRISDIKYKMNRLYS